MLCIFSHGQTKNKYFEQSISVRTGSHPTIILGLSTDSLQICRKLAAHYMRSPKKGLIFMQ